MSKHIKFCPQPLFHGVGVGGAGTVDIAAITSFLYENMKTNWITLMLFCSISYTLVFGGYCYGIPLSPYTFVFLNFKII